LETTNANFNVIFNSPIINISAIVKWMKEARDEVEGEKGEIRRE